MGWDPQWKVLIAAQLRNVFQIGQSNVPIDPHSLTRTEPRRYFRPNVLVAVRQEVAGHIEQYAVSFALWHENRLSRAIEQSQQIIFVSHFLFAVSILKSNWNAIVHCESLLKRIETANRICFVVRSKPRTETAMHFRFSHALCFIVIATLSAEWIDPRRYNSQTEPLRVFEREV